jgi:hypothetical protein
VSFIDGKPQIATKDDVEGEWGPYRDARCFRCHICGHKFREGDYWRFVYTNNLNGHHGGNPLVCEGCDGADVVDRWKALCDEFQAPRFWWFRLRGER